MMKADTMLKEKISGFIDEIRSINGVEGCALVSKDGIMIGKYFTKEISEKWFAAMSASVLASAESAASIINIRPPIQVVIHAEEGKIMITDAGERLLITTILNPGMDESIITHDVNRIALRIEEEL